jgi:toxin ParE1/3/4
LKNLQVTLSDLAISDILEQAEWYGTHSESVATRWEKAVTSALLRIAGSPRSGVPCRFKADELRGVRRSAVAGFPKHLVFYQVCDDKIIVLRIVHGARDLESLFSN